jgi:dolichol-phosphate mannosyltransferase
MLDNLSVIIPSFNEEENIEILYSRILKVINKIGIMDYEIIFIENGSTDESLTILENIRSKNSNLKILSLSRNFGYQNAILAGIHHCTKNNLFVIDGDLQDPPEMLEEFAIKMKKGFDVVYGIRKKRKSSLFKRISYYLFYELYSKMSEIEVPKQVGEFCLINIKVLNILKKLNENNIFIRGLRSWTGFKQTGIEYNREERSNGKPKFTFVGSVSLALDGIISFSLIPLRIILFLGIIMSFISLLIFAFLLIIKIIQITGFYNYELFYMPKGLTITNMILTLFLGIIILTLGIIGEYIGRIYFEVKKRPNYVIDKKYF